jgi:sarcosine oxidase
MSSSDSIRSADVLVIGLGVMGASSAYHIAKKGLTVICLDPFEPGHDRGSSHGQTRLIRQAYFEHPAYVPLVERSQQGWLDVESESGETLHRRTGLVITGPEGGNLIQGTRLAAKTHRLPIRELSQIEASNRFSGLRFHPDAVVLFEPDAGFLYAEECVRSLVKLAKAQGATVEAGARVKRWRSDGATVTAETNRGTFTAGGLVVCAGAWSPALLGGLDLPLEVRRKVVFWHVVKGGAYHVDRGTPVYGYDVDGGFFYGFPSLGGQTIKVGEHTGGNAVLSPDDLERSLRDGDHARVRGFVEQYLPEAMPQVMKHSVCMYTMTPDEHFIIDRHPGYGNVVFAAGFSGHGFKFAPVVGSVLADLLTTGTTSEPVSLFRASRFLHRDSSSIDS